MKELSVTIIKLKKFGAIAVKQSLEDEGVGFDEISFMRKITKKNDLKLNIKVGGCEAKNDINFCTTIDVDGIVAPMVESEYALKKFIQTVPKLFNGDLYINLESKNAFRNFKKIINTKEFTKLKGIVIGRSDLAGSLNLDKTKVDSERIFKLLEKNLSKIKNKKLLVKIGGSLTKNSKEFITKMYKKKLINRAETRNIELRLNNNVIKNFDEIIPLIFKFEKKWLKFRYKNFKLNKLIKKTVMNRIEELNARESKLLKT